MTEILHGLWKKKHKSMQRNPATGHKSSGSFSTSSHDNLLLHVGLEQGFNGVTSHSFLVSKAFSVAMELSAVSVAIRMDALQDIVSLCS